MGRVQNNVKVMHTAVDKLANVACTKAYSLTRWCFCNVQSHPDREFRVRGKLQPDMEKLNLRLRISEAEGALSHNTPLFLQLQAPSASHCIILPPSILLHPTAAKHPRCTQAAVTV